MANTFFGITFPNEFKPILPYLKHGAQVESRDVAMSYFCIYQAIKMAMPLMNKSAELRQPIAQLLSKLETLKPQMTAALPSNEAQLEHARNFALMVFNLADGEDRSGNATQKTAQHFYAASIFLSVVRQFFPDDQLPEDLAERQKYAKWKAADITTCLKEGRKPKPGGPLEHEQQQQLQDDTTMTHQIDSVVGLPLPSSTQSQSQFDANLFPSPPSSSPQSQSQSQFDAHLFPSPPPSAQQTPLFPSPPSSQASNSFDPNLFPSPPPSSSTSASLFPSPPASNPSSTLFPTPPAANPNPLFPSPPASFSAPPPSSTSSPSPLNPSSFPSPPSSTGALPPPSQPFFPSTPTLPTSSLSQARPTAVRQQAPPPTTHIDDNALLEAEKFARFAVSALQFEDIPTAITNLQKALDLLQK